MLFFSPPPPPPPLSSLPSWSPLPCCLIGRETLGKIAGISFHCSPWLSTRVMSCLFGIMHSRRSRSPQTPHLPPHPTGSAGAQQKYVHLSRCFRASIQHVHVRTPASSSLQRVHVRTPKRTKRIPTCSCDAGHPRRKKGEFGVFKSGF